MAKAATRTEGLWLKDVEVCHDRMLEANSATPYVHAEYDWWEKAMKKAIMRAYPHILIASEALERIYDCGEVQSYEQVARDLVNGFVSDLQMWVENLVWAVDEEWARECDREIAKFVRVIRGLDKKFDAPAKIAEYALAAAFTKGSHRHAWTPVERGKFRCYCGDYRYET